jgi:hypothetical protein
MSPVRHEDDFRARPIRSWESWVDEAIEEARERGDFDDLPGHGKPLRIETNAYEPEMNLAYSTLKNAGYAPTWMELDREITAGRAELDNFLERSAIVLATLRKQIIAQGRSVPDRVRDAHEPPPRTGRLRTIWRSLVDGLNVASEATASPVRPLPTLDDLDAIQRRMRGQYLERAAALDKLIMEFHGALPRALWHLERSRLTQEAAGRRFNARFAEPGD